MASKKKWIKLITTLNMLTQQDELAWEREEPPPPLRSRNMYADFVFTTRFMDRYLRLYELKYYDFDWDDWDSRTVLEFVDEAGRSEWELPYISPGTSDLLESVKYQVGRIDEFLEEFLRDEEESEQEESEGEGSSD